MSTNAEIKRKSAFVPCCLALAAIGACGLVLIACVVYEWTTIGSDREKAPPTQAFSSTLWLRQTWAEHDHEWPPRLLMVDCLLDSTTLDGLTYDEVVRLLGPPDYGLDAERAITYYLGPERGFIRIDSEWLSIAFSEEDVVSRAWLWRD